MQDDELKITISQLDDANVVTLRGEWDLYGRDRLHDALLSLGTQHDVVVDLRGARFFDSSALGELIALYKRVTGGGHRFETLVGDSNMQRLLDLTGLKGLLGVVPERGRYLAERLKTAQPEGV